MEYQDREDLKQEGWHQAHDVSLALEKRTEGLLKVIEAHYWRSLETYRPKRKHGTWEQYAASWLWANGNRRDGVFDGLKDVIAVLRKSFPAPRKSGIGEGMSYWGTGNDHRSATVDAGITPKS